MITPTGEERVEEIQRRHDDFVDQYSPGPDWEPCNQMSQDRGWLLSRLRKVEGELRGEIEWASECGILRTKLAQAEQRVQEVEEEFTDLQVSWQQQAERAIRAEQHVEYLAEQLKMERRLHAHELKQAEQRVATRDEQISKLIAEHAVQLAALKRQV